MAVFMWSNEDRNVTVKEIYDYRELASRHCYLSLFLQLFNGELKIIGLMFESNDDKFLPDEIDDDEDEDFVELCKDNFEEEGESLALYIPHQEAFSFPSFNLFDVECG